MECLESFSHHFTPVLCFVENKGWKCVKKMTPFYVMFVFKSISVDEAWRNNTYRSIGTPVLLIKLFLQIFPKNALVKNVALKF